MKSIIQAAHLELYHEGEFGGRIFRAEVLEDQKSYLMKCDRYGDEITEGNRLYFRKLRDNCRQIRKYE